MQNFTKGPALALFAALVTGTAATAAPRCATVIVPTVQVHLQGVTQDVELVVTNKYTEQSYVLEQDDDLYLSPPLPAGTYILQLNHAGETIVSEEAVLRKAAACYTIPLVRTYNCAWDQSGHLNCAVVAD